MIELRVVLPSGPHLIQIESLQPYFKGNSLRQKSQILIM